MGVSVAPQFRNIFAIPENYAVVDTDFYTLYARCMVLAENVFDVMPCRYIYIWHEDAQPSPQILASSVGYFV